MVKGIFSKLLLLLLLIPVVAPQPGAAQEQSITPTTQAADPLKPSDRIQLTVVGFPELSGEQAILADGSIQLPMTGAIQIGGLKPDQAIEQISTALLPYIRRPQVGLVVLSHSPLQISVTGEVLQPGPRLFNAEANGEDTPLTLSVALGLAGGVTPNADLRHIVIRRPVADATASPTEIPVNLWQVIQSGNLASDPRIYQGDEIIVPTATVSGAEQQTLLASTIAPAEITVQVAGEVQQPGSIAVNPRSGVSAAVATAGGPTENANLHKITLFRLSAEGRLQQQEFEFGEESEPLRHGDLIVVSRSNRGNVGSLFQFLGLILNPVGSVFNVLGGLSN